MAEWLLTQLTNAFEYLKDLLEWIPKKIFETIMDVLVSIIEAIPVPSWVNDVGSFWGQISGDVWFFASALQIGFGLAVIGSAYALRFLIRRLPVIG
jgi:hypothetical protein